MEENQNQTQNSGNNKNTALIVVVVVLIVALAIGGTYAFMKINELQKGNNNQPQPVATPSGEQPAEIAQNTTPAETTNTAIENNNTQTTQPTQTSTPEVTTNSSSSSAKASTKENPLKLGEWGLASKYVSKNLSTKYANTRYADVPVRVTKVTRGEAAKTIVKDWFSRQTYYKYQDPKAYMEWAVVDYEVDLNALTFDEKNYGVSMDVSSSVKGLDGSSVKHNGITYIISTTNITSREYVKKPGVYKCQFIVPLPEGCKDYLVVLGNTYDGTASYFKCE